MEVFCIEKIPMNEFPHFSNFPFCFYVRVSVGTHTHDGGNIVLESFRLRNDN